MPELSEVKIMSDFINYAQKEEGFFESIEKSKESKIKTELDPFKGSVFTIKAESRGKELMLVLEQVGGSLTEPVIKKLLCNMGMSGNWIYIRNSAPQLDKAMKHAHLKFKSTSGNWLLLYDVRRFAKWNWSEGWGKNRSYCPLTEYNQFRETLLSNWQKHKDFSKPLCEVLMNQKWFNGVGAYIRSELLYKTNINPFQPANQLSISILNELTHTLHLLFRESYQLGGGTNKELHNTNISAASFNEWFKCYGNKNMLKIVDKKGRNLWFNPIWKHQSDEYLK